MKKNIIFIPYIKREKAFGSAGHTKPRWCGGYDYGIESWKRWAENHNSKVIVFDEATSALDDKTEAEVISSLDQLDKELTIIIIAHRLTTLEICNRVLEVEDAKVNEII